ncbi:MAG: hypothetical protein ACI358_07105 [Candidatus Limimorpha sp.]
MCEQAATWIRSFGGQQEIDFDDLKGKVTPKQYHLHENSIPDREAHCYKASF